MKLRYILGAVVLAGIGACLGFSTVNRKVVPLEDYPAQEYVNQPPESPTLSGRCSPGKSSPKDSLEDKVCEPIISYKEGILEIQSSDGQNHSYTPSESPLMKALTQGHDPFNPSDFTEHTQKNPQSSANRSVFDFEGRKYTTLVFENSAAYQSLIQTYDLGTGEIVGDLLKPGKVSSIVLDQYNQKPLLVASGENVWLSHLQMRRGNPFPELLRGLLPEELKSARLPVEYAPCREKIYVPFETLVVASPFSRGVMADLPMYSGFIHPDNGSSLSELFSKSAIGSVPFIEKIVSLLPTLSEITASNLASDCASPSVCINNGFVSLSNEDLEKNGYLAKWKPLDSVTFAPDEMEKLDKLYASPQPLDK